MAASDHAPVRPATATEEASSSKASSRSPTKAVPRSKLSVTMVTRQPSFSSPTRLSTGTRTSSRNNWANSVEPAMVASGRISTPGARMSMMSHEMPRWRLSLAPVRTSSSQKSATSACEVQILVPVTT